VHPRSRNSALLQRKCACGGSTSSGGECEDCKKKSETTVQRKTSTASPQGSTLAPPIVHEVLRSPGQPLDAPTRAFFEPRFGHDFSRVRVHTDEQAAESARAVSALAYTVGDQVAFASGEYDPRTRPGQILLAHELTHVVQQGGHVASLSDLELAQISDERELEADRMASLVSHSGGVAEDHVRRWGTGKMRLASHTGTVLQRKVPTGISIKETHPFGHAEFKSEDDKKKTLTSIGDVSLMQLLPAGDYSAEQKNGECTKEFLTEVSNTCPTTRDFCSGNRCLEVGRYGSAGDAATGIMVSDGPDTFIDRHIHRQPDSFLEGSGKNKCSVVCHQMYKYRTEPGRRYHDLGAFYIIRNFQAGTFTPKGATAAINITTGGIQKVPAPSQAPSKDDFAKSVAPGLARTGTLLDAPPLPTTTATGGSGAVPKTTEEKK